MILHPFLLPSTRRLEALVNGNWEPKGAGIVIRHNNDNYMVTARHVVDERYAKGPSANRCYDRMRFLHPYFMSVGPAQESLEWRSDWLFDDGDNDLAISLLPKAENAFFRSISSAQVMSEGSFESLQLGHPLVMSGYPAGMQYVGEKPTLVCRQGVLTTSGTSGVNVPETMGNRYQLFDSFAQSGFSGSPIWAFERPAFKISSPISMGPLKINGEVVSENRQVPQFIDYD